MHQFPWMSPYVAFDNNPIYYTDPLGLASEGGPEKGETYIDNDGVERTTTHAGGDAPKTIDPDLYYVENGEGSWSQARFGILENGSVKGSVAILINEQYYLERRNKMTAQMDASLNLYYAEQNSKAMSEHQMNLLMMRNPITAMYVMSPFSAIVEATVEAEQENYLTAGIILGLEFLPGPTEDIIRSSRRVIKGGPEGRRALQKKIDGKMKSKYFSNTSLGRGNKSAEDIIRSVMDHPNRQMVKRPKADRNGDFNIDFFNPDTGQGVRIDAKTGEFRTFINID